MKYEEKITRQEHLIELLRREERYYEDHPISHRLAVHASKNIFVLSAMQRWMRGEIVLTEALLLIVESLGKVNRQLQAELDKASAAKLTKRKPR